VTNYHYGDNYGDTFMGPVHGDVIKTFGASGHSVGKSQTVAPDVTAALDELRAAIQALYPRVGDDDRRTFDAALHVIETDAPAPSSRVKRALRDIAGIAGVVGQVGAPVIAAVRAVLVALGIGSA